MRNDHPKNSPWTVLGTLQWTVNYFKRRNITHPRAVAEVLLAHVLDCQRIDLYLRYDQPLQSEELAQFKKLIQRRANREPEAYIVGHKEFWSLRFKVSPAVLIPRPETECVVETVLRLLGTNQQARILELGTGSGAISVALASEKKRWQCWASDVSHPVVELARCNARRLLGRDGIHFFVGSWLDSTSSAGVQFDAIIANPPYIASADIETLAPEIRQFEPRNALDGGPNGMHCLSEIFKNAADHLVADGHLILEMGHDQRPAMEALADEIDTYDEMIIHKDYSGFDRVVQIKKSF